VSWVGNAFGLSLQSEFELPGLQRARGAATNPPRVGPEPRRVSLTLEEGAQRANVDWGERLQEWHAPDEEIGLAIDSHDVNGYRFYVRDVGVFELTRDGSRAVCRPAPASGWHWRRYLISQVLPFAALLHGLEVFHASAVELGGGAVALAGATGLGKSTLALNMHLGGMGFLTDDVVAVQVEGSKVIAQPGIAAAKVRRQARDLVSADRRGLLCKRVTENEHETRYELRRSTGPLPLSVVCTLEQSPETGGLEVREEDADPWHLLGNTFNLLLQHPDRLRAQLDLCTMIAKQARFLRVNVPSRPGPAAAAQLAAHLKRLT